MLGITVPDAIAIGTLIIAVLAAWRGNGAGKTAKMAGPPPDSTVALIGAAIVDQQTLASLTHAVVRLVDVLERAVDENERAVGEKLDNMQETVKQLAEGLSDAQGHRQRR